MRPHKLHKQPPLTHESTFAGDLRSIRSRLALSQSVCADILGVSCRTLNAWENGASVPVVTQEGARAMLSKYEAARTDVEQGS